MQQSVQVKQLNYPNLNAGNPGVWAMKWETPEERKEACKNYCDYLKKGYPKDYYPDADDETISRYIKDFPEEFAIEDIKQAEREGKSQLIRTMYAGALGKVEGFKEKSFMFILNNMTNWRLKNDLTSDGQKIESPILYIPAENKNE